MEWREMKKEVPQEDMMCLVVMGKTTRIEVLNWNHHYKSWDDYEADDHFCDADKVSFWIPFSDFPEIPEHN